MLSLLLDENISPTVAEQIRTKRLDVRIQCVSNWREGECLGMSDEHILIAARHEGLTLVTYDKRITSDHAHLFTGDAEVAGIILVDEKTIPKNDFGGLVNSLLYVWDEKQNLDWRNRIIYLPAIR